jgi:hypothetical protein
MKNRNVPRVGAPGCRKLTYQHSSSCNLNPLVKRKINVFSEPNDFAAIKETKKLELQTPLNLREFRATAAETILKTMHIKTIESSEILIWESGVYRVGGQRKLEALCQKLADDQRRGISNGTVSEIIGTVKRRTSCDIHFLTQIQCK